tara:strand:- start:274 stop:1401 length:1128 start_codon:yes stop_codon:yes gene_type:complete
MKTVVFVFGTRPEAIKMAPVINIFKKDTLNFNTIVVVTGQHREMLGQALDVFNIIPDFNLDLMTKGQSLQSLTNKILKCISNLFNKIIPDLIFVQGDTTTTFTVSLAAFYKKIPVAHIEAGLRTNDKFSPFPEEINRKMTTAIATYHFPPTEQAKENLIIEGIRKQYIKVTGNTIIDSLLLISEKIDSEIHYYDRYFTNQYGINLNERNTILVTGHRRESFGQGFENICNAIRKLSKNKDFQIIYPVHLNPNVQEPVNRILANLSNVHLIPPQDYKYFVYLMKKSFLILTDSGGVQEEAPSLNKPVLIMRNNTERPEGILAGTAFLVGTSSKKIIDLIEKLINDESAYHKMAMAKNPYGDGDASMKIHKHISNNI